MQTAPHAPSLLDAGAFAAALPREEAGGLDALPNAFLTELLLRHLFRLGELRLFEISQRMALPLGRIEALLAHMRELTLVEVPRRGDLDVDVSYALTDWGHQQARVAFEKSQYVGPTPVTLDEYVAQVGRQSRRAYPTTAPVLRQALGDLVIEEPMLPTLGSALNSGKAIYIYGPSGSGKTYLAEHLVRTLRGPVLVPHALYVDGEVIQYYDPLVHHAVEEPAAAGHGLARDAAHDGRWVLVKRPVVVTGGELTLQMLDLEFDRVSRLYVAPPQMKANNGIFIVDDLGRQRVSAHELLNRWIVPLDRHVDYMGLHTGGKFSVPFDVTVIFSSNYAPDELADPAFARRLGYKIYIGAMRPDDYRVVVAQACARAGLALDDAAADFLMNHLHARDGRPYLPTIPYDVISKIGDRSRYLEQPPRLTPELLEWAWSMYFGEAAQDARPADAAGAVKENGRKV